MADVTKEQRDNIIQAIHDAHGKVTLAVQRLKATGSPISRSTLYRYAKQYATIQNAIDEARTNFDESLVDIAEWKLREAVMSGEQWAVKYTLTTKGKERGYVERQELTGADGGPIKGYAVFSPDDWDDDEA